MGVNFEFSKAHLASLCTYEVSSGPKPMVDELLLGNRWRRRRQRRRQRRWSCLTFLRKLEQIGLSSMPFLWGSLVHDLGLRPGRGLGWLAYAGGWLKFGFGGGGCPQCC